MNFEQALKKRVELQHKGAVLEELIDYLNQFLPSDLGASEAVLEIEDCTEPVVGQPAIESVMDMLSGAHTKVVKELTALSKMRIADGKKKK